MKERTKPNKAKFLSYFAFRLIGLSYLEKPGVLHSKYGYFHLQILFVKSNIYCSLFFIHFYGKIRCIIQTRSEIG